MEKNIEKIVLDEIQSEVDVDADLISRDIGLVSHVKVEVKVCVGTVELTVEDLFSIKSGEVLSLNEDLNSPVTLFVDGKPVARGILVAVDDKFGVKISEVSN